MANVLYLGLDVDDNAFHGYAICKQTGEYFEFSCKPNITSLQRQLLKFIDLGFTLKMCYEASYLGFSLQRDLQRLGHYCDVIAPSLVPQLSGHRVKTDRIDAKKLSEYYMKDLLTVVHAPSLQDESVRDLIRARAFLADQAKALKLYINSLCRRYNFNYRQSEGKTSESSYWTEGHRKWLRRQVQSLDQAAAKKNLENLIYCLEQQEGQIKSYDQEIKEWGQTPAYEKSVQALCCYRGIKTLRALTLITEIGDIKRFSHPKQLVSYAGMDITEYSSGGHERKYHISKLGNRHIRTALIESSQQAKVAPKISRDLKQRREGVDLKMVDIADRCMQRLNKKSLRLLHREKQPNKVKVACAREMVGFIWETLRGV